MGIGQPFRPAKLLAGIIASDEAVFTMGESELVGKYGPISLRSEEFSFDSTRYYEKEMGRGLKRRFVGFERLVSPDSLSCIKAETNSIEEMMRNKSPESRRIINIDPGILTASSLIMATTKNFSHRVPLKDGIYAHLELLFSKKGIQVLDWTYPDFRTQEYHPFLLNLRGQYLSQITQK